MKAKIDSTFVFICLLALTSCAGNPNKVPEKPTFTEHVAPILNKNCVQCHYDGGVAPFSLTSYKQAKNKAKTIAKVTALRIMPPWPADPTYSHFIGEKFLTQEEIATLQNWAQTGAVEGPRDKMPKFNIPQYNSSIGKPDLVLYLDTVQLFPDFRDRFFLYKIPGQIAKDTWVRAVEFVAGTPDLVHHFNGHLLLYDKEKKKNPFALPLKTEITKGEYDEDFGKLNLAQDDASLPLRIHSAVNYLPGVFGTAYPDGIGTFRLTEKFAFVGNDMHYGPSDRKIIDRSRINVFFSQKPPDRPTAEIMLGTNGVSKIEPPLQIPPNVVSMHTTRFRVPESISILTVNPHLHMLGKSFVAFAIKPNGDTIPLIRIKKWDFRWQYFYTFQKMVPVPKGSEIVAIAEFDNTADNPDNPNKPPKTVGERLEFGGSSMRATDEMFQFIITYTAYKAGDEDFSLLRKQ